MTENERKEIAIRYSDALPLLPRVARNLTGSVVVQSVHDVPVLLSEINRLDAEIERLNKVVAALSLGYTGPWS